MWMRQPYEASNIQPLIGNLQYRDEENEKEDDHAPWDSQ